MKRFLDRSLLALGLVVFTSLAVEAMLPPKPLLPALGTTSDILMANRLRGRVRFRVQPSRYRVGAFARGQGCPSKVQENFQPVVPNLSSMVGEGSEANLGNSESVSNQTTSVRAGSIPSYLSASPHPVFLINVPAMPGAIGRLFVEIPDKPLTERQQYKVDFDLPDKAGVIGVAIPAAAPPLQEGPVYLWRVSVECSPGDRNEDVFGVRGAAFKQVAEPDGTPEERLNYYLENGVWQDTAAVLAAERFADASAAADEEWATLMEVSGLTQFANIPIIDIQEGRLIRQESP